MDMYAEIDKAIEYHLAWKRELNLIILSGYSPKGSKFITQGKNNKLNQWLQENIPTKIRYDRHYKRVKAIHKQFLKVAERIVEMSISGRIVEAKKLISEGSEYEAVSYKLINELNFWKVQFIDAA